MTLSSLKYNCFIATGAKYEVTSYDVSIKNAVGAALLHLL